ncbi:HIT family protein [Candidatus Nomurabacteria bacterium]|nr:HIT family protein [Candidatus Nomurabacteria bacterium]
MSTIFTKIIEREIPAQFIYEDDICIAIMDKFPAVNGQSLVIPKKEVDYVFELDEETYHHIFNIAKKVAKASDEAFATLRTCLIVEGFEIPHVHIKLYPMTASDKSVGSVSREVSERSDEELEVAAEKIRTSLVNLS